MTTAAHESVAPRSTSSRPAGAGATERIKALWARLGPRPGGKWLFSRLLGFTAPYSGTIRARVEELRPGYAQVSMRDRRGVRNHLRSVHAIALMNLAEMSTGLATVYSLPDGMRGIITHLEIDYLKKARGTITAECRAEIPEVAEEQDVELSVDLKNTQGEIVAQARARWLVRPVA
jgi:acyl-coenzyme A thioesterase PaaI-like protein